MHLLHRLPVFSVEKPKQQRLFRSHPTLFFFLSRPNRRCSMNRSADLVSAELFPSPSLLTHQERSCEDPKEGKPRWDTVALAHSHTSQPGLRRCVPPPPPFEPASCCRATRDQYDSHVSQHPSLLHCQEPAGWRRGFTTGEGSDTRGRVVMRHFFYLFVCFSFFLFEFRCRLLAECL